MMKHEFEKMIGRTVSQEDYDLIEDVYAFYPGIPEVGGKEVVVQLYLQFGLRIFEDMAQRARVIKEHLREIEIHQIKINCIREEISKL